MIEKKEIKLYILDVLGGKGNIDDIDEDGVINVIYNYVDLLNKDRIEEAMTYLRTHFDILREIL